MATAFQFLTSPPSKTRVRVYDVFGPDATLRDSVLQLIEQRVAAAERVRLQAGTVSDEEIWRVVATVPLAGVASRLVVVSAADRVKKWDGLIRFVRDKALYSETVLVFVSDRVEAGSRVRSSGQKFPGKPLWTTVLAEWESLIRENSAGVAVSCVVPAIELPATGTRGGVGALSPLAKWLSLRLPVTQQQAEYLWIRAGEQTALARDVVDQLVLIGITDAVRMGTTEFRAAVDAVMTAHGSEDFAELLLFGRKQLALTSLFDHSFSAADWSRILGYLSQRLDWLAPLHVALGTNERLDQVQRRLGIHRKFILQYAHREDPSHNIAKHYDRARVARCRGLLADLDAALAAVPGVPVALGEVLVACW